MDKLNREFIKLMNGEIIEVSDFDHHYEHIDDHIKILKDLTVANDFKEDIYYPRSY